MAECTEDNVTYSRGPKCKDGKHTWTTGGWSSMPGDLCDCHTKEWPAAMCTEDNHKWTVDFSKGECIESGQPCQCGKRNWPGPKLSTEEARAAVRKVEGNEGSELSE